MKKLVNTFKMDGYKKIELHFEKRDEKCIVKANGCFCLPDIIREFDTYEEAKTFMEGISWAVQYFGGDVAHYMK